MPTALPLRTPPAGVRPVRLRASLTAVACLLGTLAVTTVVLVGWCAPAHAQANKDDLASTVAKLNKKALDEYENLNFDEARKILKDALDFCHEAGLDQHPVTARTNIHLGVVVLTGFKQRDAATKYFRKAIEIQPDIKMTKSLANPEIQAAFDEVVASMKGSSQVTPPPIKSGAESGISHEPVTRGPQGQSIPITVTIDPSLTPDKVLLWYRTGPTGDFTSRDMTEATPGNFAAELPPTATGGSQVSYFIEAQKGGQPIATLGSQASPFPVALSAPTPPMGVQRLRPRPVSARASGGSPSFYLGLSVGSGVGWASGAGEINTLHTTDPAGFAPAQAVHVSPEIGYFLSPDLLLSVQARIQFLSGLTSMTCANTCASPPSTAIAAFARLTWFLSTESLKPYLSASVGGGRIRHVAEFPKYTDCGTGTTTCVESIPAGAVLLGPGAGIAYSLTPGFGLVGGLNTQLGFPRFTFNVDLNVGVAATF